MGKASPPSRIAFIGAGPGNFGSSGGLVPGESLGGWNHAIRLEQLLDVVVTAIVDPHHKLAEHHLKKHQQGPHAEKWRNVSIFASHRDMLQSQAHPDAAIVAAPSNVRGGLDSPELTMDLDFAEAGVHMLVEKPISIQSGDEVLRLSDRLQELQKRKQLVISVDYQMRYLPAIDAVKKILKEHGAPIAAIIGRYHGVYNRIKRAYHWDDAVSGGVIVQQATHFADLCRYIGGDIIPDSVIASSVGAGYPLAETAELAPEGEAPVPESQRSNRVTFASWHFESGAIGTLMHTKVLHELNYFTEMEILADGLHIIVVDPYNAPAVKVRRPHSQDYEQIDLGEPTDMYMLQMKAFVDAVRGESSPDIRSTFASAAKTYALTQLIQEAAKQQRSYPVGKSTSVQPGSKAIDVEE